jgi:hypothetical protein
LNKKEKEKNQKELMFLYQLNAGIHVNNFHNLPMARVQQSIKNTVLKLPLLSVTAKISKTRSRYI